MRLGQTYDAIVLGTGGAGLLLLDAMLRHGWLKAHRVLAIEPEEKAVNDRTWCFWTDGNDTLGCHYKSVISHQWTQVDNGLGKVDKLGPYSYCQIRSLDFYNDVKSRLAHHTSIDWLRGHGEIENEHSDQMAVRCGEKTFFAKRIFDSRPFSPEEADNILARNDWMWQSFVGYRVRTERVMDSDTCTLMDFNIPQNGQSQFVYTLPTSENEALFELTRFGKSCLSSEEAANILHDYISERVGSYEVLEIEIGKIPMTLALNPESKYHLRDQVVIPLGTRAGAVKSTTGYAFKFMAEHADNIVNALQSGTAIPTAYHHLRLSLYDKILLRVLAMDPSIGKSVFQRLFSKRKTSEVLKFLDEKTNIWEEFRILSVLPYRPFLQGLANIVSEKTALYKNRSAGRQNLAFPLYESVVMGIAFVAVFLNHFSPNLVALSTPWILLGGLIFPGIPHGAVDHWVALGKQLQWSNLFRFVFKYIVLMGGIAFIWWLTPAVGFLLFLIYSAWHFGETDLRDWNAYNPWQAILWGTSVLGTLLFGHLDSLEPFLSAYGIEYIYSSVLLMQKPLLLASLFGLSLSGWFQRKAALGAWARTSFILILGFALPLLLAFAFYFIGCHSARGWSHLQNELEVDNSRMLVMSLPFSLGAWAMAASLFFLLRTQDLEPENIWPLVFVFIAAISGPHVYIMHMMYRRRALK